MDALSQFAREFSEAYIFEFHTAPFAVFFVFHVCLVILNFASYKGSYRFIAPLYLLIAFVALLYTPAQSLLIKILIAHLSSSSNAWSHPNIELYRMVSKIIGVIFFGLILGYGLFQLYEFLKTRRGSAYPTMPTAAPPQNETPTTQQESPHPFSERSPPKGMALRLKRGERSSAFGKIIFTLDARIDVSAENRALISKYDLGSRVIYESANREKYRQRAAGHLDKSSDTPGFRASSEQQFFGIGKTLFRLGAAAVTATASALSLRVTVNSLMSGVHIECKDMDELLDAELSIRVAGQNLKAEIETATSFTGQEDVIDL